MRLRTVFPPMPTPFADGEVDRAAIAANVARWIAEGLGGAVVLGTNGEAYLLDDDECDAVVEAARAAVPRDRVLIAGVGRESTRATVRAAKRAAALGADAVLVRTPSLYRGHTPPAALEAHFRRVADESPVPTLLYNYPAFFGVNLSADLVSRLAAHANIIGMKETSTDGAQFIDLAAAVPASFTILAGSAPGVFPALSAGAGGAILAVACILPSACLEILTLTAAGRYDEARAAQQGLNPLARAVTTTYGIAGLKAAMDMLGYRGGPPRPPLAPLGADAAEKLRALLRAAGHLHAGAGAR